MMSALLLGFSGLLLGTLAIAMAARDRELFLRKIRTLEEKVLEAKKVVERKGNLASEIAHDIKNPLTAILCSAEALDRMIGQEIDPMHRSTLQYIREYGDTLLHLMSDFLDVNRAEAGQLEASVERVAIGAIARSVVGILDANAEKKGLHIHCAIDETIDGKCDAKHLRQILFNLVHNAIKFTPRGGEIQVQVFADNDSVVVQVADNGVGISKQVLPRLFDPYARYDVEERPEFEVGFGLGLALSKVLIELSGGSISVQSEEGKGACFIVRVPQWRPAQQEATLPTRAHQKSTPLVGQRFLIVEGDDSARAALTDLIRAMGGAVDGVKEAADAVEAICRSQYDAVMIDRDGDPEGADQLAKMIKGEMKESTTVIVASENLTQSMKDDRIDHYLPKPFNGEQLLKSLLNSGKYQVTH